jgi:hypothetical protein
MSNPERLTLHRQDQPKEELTVTIFSEDMDHRRDCAVPREIDVAMVLAHVSNEWFDRFMAALQTVSVKRALLVSRVTERVELAPSAAAIADVAGGDVDPGFGVDPQDSARLLELRQAIDSIGWKSPADEEKGDYLARLHEIREELAIVDVAVGRALKAERQVRTQRADLRRFNREARARKEANVPLHVTHDRWLSKLHALEQKTANGTASQADCIAIERLKRWLGDNP